MPEEDRRSEGARPSDPANWAEAEVAGEHGRTAFKESLEDERHPEINPQTPGGLSRKLKEEAGEGDDLGDKAKRAAEELDRTFSGEYERRDEVDADEQPGAE